MSVTMTTGVLSEILQATQLSHSQDYYWITRPFTNVFLGKSNDLGLFPDTLRVVSVNGVKADNYSLHIRETKDKYRWLHGLLVL